MKLPYLIAELSCNHEGNLNEMYELIDLAKNLKINCVKIQSYTADTISSNVKIKGNTIWKNTEAKKLYQMAHTPRDWHKKIIEYCKQCGIDLFTTVYSENDLKFTKKFNFKNYKIASFELTDLNLIELTSKISKNIIISNGMSYFSEIENACNTIKKNKANPIILHCNSGYPAKFSELDLNSIHFLKKYFRCKVGFSDHTLFKNVDTLSGLEPWIAPLCATYMGAEILEFHLIKNREKSKALFKKKIGGFDWAFSKEPHEVETMISKIKKYKKSDLPLKLSIKHKKLFLEMMGGIKLKPSKREIETLKLKPSLWVTGNIKKGSKLKFGYGHKFNFDSLRPNNGLDLKFFKFLNGKKVNKNLKKGSPLKLTDVILH